MGRLFEALKQAGPPAPQEDQPPVLRAVETEEEEIPFIEVGPCRSMEASPSVLASLPAVRAPRAETPEADEGAALPLPGVPASCVQQWNAGVQQRNDDRVAFRALGERAAPAARSPFARELVAYHAPDGPAGLQYRDLLSGLLSATGIVQGGAGRAVLATGSRSGLGTTTALLNIAIAAARQGRRRVLVLDGNLGRPAVAERLGLLPAPGLREVLAGSVALEQAVRETAQPDLLALTAGELVSPTGGARFVAETFRSLLRRLRQRFDLVFVDGPPWESLAGSPRGANHLPSEVRTLVGAVDAVCLVLGEQEAETPEADELFQSVLAQGARLAGCILVGR
jgi:Mrp family chromosome partitioning ATPase